MGWEFWAAVAALFGVLLKLNLMDERLKEVQKHLDDEAQRGREESLLHKAWLEKSARGGDEL